MRTLAPSFGRFVAFGARLAARLAEPVSDQAARRARILAALADEGQLDLAGVVASARLRQSFERIGRLASGLNRPPPLPDWRTGGSPLRVGPDVIYAVSSMDAGGAEQMDLTAMEALAEAGWRINLACAGRSEGAFAGRFLSLSTRWMAFGGVGLSAAEEDRLLEAAVLQIRPQLLIVRHVRAAYAALRTANDVGTKCVDIIHTTTPTIGDWIDFARPFAPMLHGRICSSGMVRNALVSRGGSRSEAVHIAPVFVPSAAAPDANERAKSRQDFGLRGEAPVIGSVGRLAPEKGMDRWLQVAACIARLEPGAQFLIAGDGPMRRAITDRARRLGILDRIRMPGRIDNVRSAYAAMDVFLLTSRHEGIPLTPLEALASGVPVAALEVGAIREALQPPVAALLPPDSGADVIAASVIALLRSCSNSEPDRENSARLISSRFSREAMQRSFVAACNAALSRHDPAHEGPAS